MIFVRRFNMLDEMKPVVQVTNVFVLRAPARGMARPRGRVGAIPAKMVVIGGPGEARTILAYSTHAQLA